jgi:hypothetical protein
MNDEQQTRCRQPSPFFRDLPGKHLGNAAGTVWKLRWNPGVHGADCFAYGRTLKLWAPIQPA